MARSAGRSVDTQTRPASPRSSTGPVRPPRPLAVDVATYDGQPAVVVVLPEDSISSAASQVDVWVVGAACVDADEA